MLQIVTKMYFREGVPLFSTDHRTVLYTNRNFLREAALELPIGQLAPSSGIDPVSTVTATVTEHLEAELPNGERSSHHATGGVDLIDDLADVLSFALDSVFHRDSDTVRRLVPNSISDSSRSAASKIFLNTFDPARFIGDEEIAEFDRFFERLLSLHRGHFEAAMRAIRRIVRATQWATADQTVSYVHLVAALESLSEDTDADPIPWEHFDSRKRKLLEPTLDAVDAEAAKRIRDAILEAERAGKKRRFVAFVEDSLRPSYFREEASGSRFPLRRPDLRRALRIAYDVRSGSVHALEELPAEVMVLGERADTVESLEFGTMLSLQGLVRLARHVVETYVLRAPVGVDDDFNWRASLPGVLQMRAAPKYWIWNARAFDPDSAGRYFAGCVDCLVDAMAGRSDGVNDLTEVREEIERLLPGTSDEEAKRSMLAIYAMWNQIGPIGAIRPMAIQLISNYARLLEEPSIQSFVVSILLGEAPDWTPQQWAALAAERREERSKRRHLRLPPSIDAALQAAGAVQLAATGNAMDAKSLAANAVEELPGNAEQLAWEARVQMGEDIDIDLRALALQLDPDAEEKPAAGPD